jgi:hypothetical protein
MNVRACFEVAPKKSIVLTKRLDARNLLEMEHNKSLELSADGPSATSDDGALINSFGADAGWQLNSMLWRPKLAATYGCKQVWVGGDQPRKYGESRRLPDRYD